MFLVQSPLQIHGSLQDSCDAVYIPIPIAELLHARWLPALSTQISRETDAGSFKYTIIEKDRSISLYRQSKRYAERAADFMRSAVR